MRKIFSLLAFVFLLSTCALAQEGNSVPEPDVNAQIPENLEGAGSPPEFEGFAPPSDADFHEPGVDDSDVLVLTEATFDEAIKNNKYILVEFYARKI